MNEQIEGRRVSAMVLSCGLGEGREGESGEEREREERERKEGGREKGRGRDE